MRHAVIRHYGLSIALPSDYPSVADVVPYEVDWDGLVRGEVERRELAERLELLKSQGVMPIVAVFIPEIAETGG